METFSSRLEMQAEQVWAANWRDDHTAASATNYPHQWLQDSVYIAEGLRWLDAEKAAQELNTLLAAQWQNGMLPHQVFTRGRLGGEPQLNLDYLVWGSRRNPDAPRDTLTSGITQPPVLADAVWRVGERMSGRRRHEFFQETVPKLANYHTWIYRERDLNDSGLMSAVHPWETGMDNSPPWARHMQAGEHSALTFAAGKLATGGLINRLRRDIRETDATQRTSNITNAANANAALRLRHLKYDSAQMRARHSPYVEDIAMNSILIRNNTILCELAASSGHRLSSDLTAKMAQTERNLNQLLDDETRLYFSRDALTGEPWKIPTIASLLPIYAGSLAVGRTAKLAEHLKNSASFASQFSIPSVPIDSPYFQELSMWSGPVWLNTNHLVLDGLERAGYADQAEALSESTLLMVAKNGMYEYFSALTGRGLGVQNFSWTAALTIDLLHRAN
ncbi:MAG: MGH1-like glycoside hydrolase domain-containing protein [Candidatus Saccharimonadales bacterium]